MTMRTLAPSAAAVLAVLATATGALAQCAMCGNSFGQNDPTIGAFNTSVLFLMAAPYAIFFTAAGCVAWLYRRGVIGRRATVIPLSRKHMPADGPEEVTP